MAIGDVFFASIEKLVPGGEGLAAHEGKRVFVPLAAPGDLVRARITEEHPLWARAEILEVPEPSPDRVIPPCPLYGRCGGCNLQHLSYEAQLRVKEGILAEALTRTGGAAETPVPAAVPSAPWEYRNRLSLHAVRTNRGPRCGLRERRSAGVVPLADCPAADPVLRRALPELIPPPGKDRFTVYGRSGGDILLAEEGTRGPGGSPPSRGMITLLDRPILVDAGCFFQSNAGPPLETLIRRLREWAERAVSAAANRPGTTGRPAVADLYAGVGTFSLFLADLFPGGADLLEENPASLEAARINLAVRDRSAGDKDRRRFRFFARRDEQWARKHRLDTYAFAVADPPRQGFSPSLSRLLCRAGPPFVAYVSCDVPTFARDCRILLEGYSLAELRLFDFYPQTSHIECMGIFIRKSL